MKNVFKCLKFMKCCNRKQIYNAIFSSHKLELKVKSIGTNQDRRWLMQIGVKMVHKKNHVKYKFT